MSGHEDFGDPSAALQSARRMKRRAITARIDELVESHGSLRRAGRALNIDHAYLHRLRCGEKTEPSASVLRSLGLERAAPSQGEDA